MTEQEYINVSDLTKITGAINVLREIVPDNSEIIENKKLVGIICKLSEWQSKLFESINIEQD